MFPLMVGGGVYCRPGTSISSCQHISRAQGNDKGHWGNDQGHQGKHMGHQGKDQGHCGLLLLHGTVSGQELCWYSSPQTLAVNYCDYPMGSDLIMQPG